MKNDKTNSNIYIYILYSFNSTCLIWRSIRDICTVGITSLTMLTAYNVSWFKALKIELHELFIVEFKCEKLVYRSLELKLVQKETETPKKRSKEGIQCIHIDCNTYIYVFGHHLKLNCQFNDIRIGWDAYAAAGIVDNSLKYFFFFHKKLYIFLRIDATSK